MDLEFFNAQGLERNLKATIHKTGKLGFTIETAKKMGLEQGKSISIARDKSNPADTTLYLVMNDGRKEGAFPVSKAGQYYYLNAKSLFDALGIDYLSTTVTYDVSEITHDDTKMYKFKRRETKKKDTVTPTL